MAANYYEEVHSFISKFSFLCAHGVNANLQFNNSDGNVSVCLKAELNSIASPSTFRVQPKPPHCKPSKVRRRRRRQCSRDENSMKAATEASDQDVTISNLTSPDDASILLSLLSSSDLDTGCDKQCINSAVQATPDSNDATTETLPLKKPNLTISTNASISIPPRPVYHPAIINASQSFYKKHPSELTEEEIANFNVYLKWKQDAGEPVETDVIYLPSSMRDCLHCGYPT